VAKIEGVDVTRKLAQAQEEIGIDIAVMLDGVRSPAGIAQVVVTAPLRLWHRYRTLEMVYGDAFNSQLNDRYAGRRDEFHEMAKQGHERVIQSGLGMAADPIPQSASPVVNTAAGGLADGTYYVAAAWTNGAGEEGASSVPTKVTVSGSSFDVHHGEAPANAKGWHVYVGSSPVGMLRQNAGVIGLGAVWHQPDAVAVGKRAGSGQGPGFVVAVPRVIWRG
jgi:hypothetical protein